MEPLFLEDPLSTLEPEPMELEELGVDAIHELYHRSISSSGHGYMVHGIGRMIRIL